MLSSLSLIAALAIPTASPNHSQVQNPTPIVVLAAPSQLAEQKLGSYSLPTLTAEQAKTFARENHWRYEESGGKGFLIDSFGAGLHLSRLRLLANQSLIEGKTELESDRTGEFGTLVKLFLAGSSSLSSESVKASNVKFIILPADQVRVAAADGTSTAAEVHKHPTEPAAMPQTTELAFVSNQNAAAAQKRGRVIYPGNVKLAAAFCNVSGESAKKALQQEGLRIIAEILDEEARQVAAIKKKQFGGLSLDWQAIIAKAEEKSSLGSLSPSQKELLFLRVVQKEKIPALQSGGKFEGVSPVLLIRVFLKPFDGNEQHISVVL